MGAGISMLCPKSQGLGIWSRREWDSRALRLITATASAFPFTPPRAHFSRKPLPERTSSQSHGYASQCFPGWSALQTGSATINCCYLAAPRRVSLSRFILPLWSGMPLCSKDGCLWDFCGRLIQTMGSQGRALFYSAVDFAVLILQIMGRY